MSAPFEIYLFIPEGMPAEDTVTKTHAVMQGHGAFIDEDCLIILHDTETEEPEPRNVIDPIADLKLLSDWPTYGYIDYVAPEIMVFGISLSGIPNQKTINCVKISFTSGVYIGTMPESEVFFLSLAKDLHAVLGAKRTFMAFDPVHYAGFEIEDEIERLKKGQIEGHYEMLDIIRAD